MLKDYDISILYHLRKANVEEDALNSKAVSMGSLDFISISKNSFALYIHYLAKMMVRLDISDHKGIIASVEARSAQFELI